MEIELIRADDLTESHLDMWSLLQNTDDFLKDPFFSAEFTRAVSTIRDHVEIAVFRQNGEIVSFLPFERRGRIGHPVGVGVSEIQGFIARRNFVCDANQLLEKTGLRGWHFECVPAEQAALKPYQFCQRDFAFFDIRDGFEAYREGRRQAGSSQISQALRKARKIDREVGPLRFELHTTEDSVFEALLEWKSAQYERTGTLDRFRFRWIVELLELLRTVQTEEFSGQLSALYAGEQVIAVHMGIRSRNVLAWCYPTYDQTFEKYSPGSILLTKLAEASAEAGIERVDLGQGPERYKQSFKTGDFCVAEGAIEKRPLVRLFRKGWIQTRDWVGSSPLGETPLRMFRSVRNWAAYKRDARPVAGIQNPSQELELETTRS